MYKQMVLPRWRGFNLDRTHQMDRHFLEEDFILIRELGFDFVRLPLNYTTWIENNDPFEINPDKLEFIDEAIDWGRKYGIHVCVNFHRAPGFCVGGIELEPFRLFKHMTAQYCLIEHWNYLARRYKGIPSERLSFNLVNEPRDVSPRKHAEVMRETVARIRQIDPQRLIILDGLNTGNEVPTDLADLARQNVAFSTRGYAPLGVTHYLATWGLHPQLETEPPNWPGGRGRVSSTDYYDGLWDRNRLEKRYQVWAGIAEAAHLGVMCGECGCFNRTPHDVALNWMKDLLDVFTEANIGYSLWNFRGPFGILDSGREDVTYEDWHGHKLDRKMTDLLRQH